MNKIIFDVTYLAHWQGNLTGITRMISELAIRYEENPECIFVIWDTQSSIFFETNIKEVIDSHGKKIKYKAHNSNLNSVHNDTLVTRVARKLESYHVPMARRAYNTLYKVHSKKFKPLIPHAGDVFFIPMGEWANLQYTNKIVELSKQKISIVQVIHDMLPLVTPQYSGHSTAIMYRYCRAVLPVSAMILSVSESTKRDLVNWLRSEKLKVPPVRIFRHGEDFTKTTPRRPKDLAFQKKGNDFLLCVGTIEARKNHTLLYYVYKLANTRKVDIPDLVIVGRRGWHTDDFYNLVTSDPETKDRITILSDIDDNELYWLYENCIFTVYPSFYEGWGMPIAESIARGKTCLASNTSSMPEIANNLIEYFNPASTDECLESIQKMIIPTNLANAQKKIRRFKQTNWDETVKKIDKLIRGIQ